MKYILSFLGLGLLFSCAVKNLEISGHSIENGGDIKFEKFDKGSHSYFVSTIYDSLHRECGKGTAIDRYRNGCIVGYKKVIIKEIENDTITKTSMDEDGTTIQKVFVHKKLIQTKKLNHHEGITIMFVRFGLP